jgi:hypothetical protein
LETFFAEPSSPRNFCAAAATAGPALAPVQNLHTNWASELATARDFGAQEGLSLPPVDGSDRNEAFFAESSLTRADSVDDIIDAYEAYQDDTDDGVPNRQITAGNPDSEEQEIRAIQSSLRELGD